MLPCFDRWLPWPSTVWLCEEWPDPPCPQLRSGRLSLGEWDLGGSACGMDETASEIIFLFFFSEFQCFLYVLFYVLLDLRKCAEIGRRGELFHCVIESMFLLGLLNSMFSTISDFISASSRLFSTFPFPIWCCWRCCWWCWWCWCCWWKWSSWCWLGRRYPPTSVLIWSLSDIILDVTGRYKGSKYRPKI